MHPEDVRRHGESIGFKAYFLYHWGNESVSVYAGPSEAYAHCIYGGGPDYLYHSGIISARTVEQEAFEYHTGGLGSLRNAPCPMAHYYTTEKKVANGGHNEPVYENQWVEDTIRVCEICGQQEP